MATANDYLSDNALDLVISNGDFKSGPSDKQASILLMNSSKGSFKLHPFAGMGIKKYLGSTGQEQIIKREIYVQHEGDGMRVKDLILNSSNFTTETFYLSFNRPGFD